VTWLDDAVLFCNTLVDRIVTGDPGPEEASRLRETLSYRDGLITVCEVYRLFAIEGDDAVRTRLSFAMADDGIVVAPSIRAFRERKVRVLNGAHTILAPVGLLSGLETVREAVDDEAVGRFLRTVMLDEIVPSLSVADGDSYARDVWQRFANPFIEHSLIGITLQATTKLRVRVVPSIVELYERTGRIATGLAFGFAAYLLFARGDFQAQRLESGLRVPEDSQVDRVRECWRSTDPESDDAIDSLVDIVCADVSLWGADLTQISGFVDIVSEHLRAAIRHGVRPALDAFLAGSEPSTHVRA
jgi:tagaturonate reductase